MIDCGLQIEDFRSNRSWEAGLNLQRRPEMKIQFSVLGSQFSDVSSQIELNLKSAIYNHDSLARAFSSISPATSAAERGVSGITHLTLPALISSCAIRHGLREGVSMTGGAPPWSCRARRAATRMYR